MFRHVVLFRLHDGISPATVDHAVATLRELGDAVAHEGWRVERSLDERKGIVIVEDATFADEATFQAFRAHPAHLAAVAVMREIADWMVGDYEIDTPR